MPSATLIESLSIELKARHIFADALLKVLLNKQEALMHIELQTCEDPTMGGRLLEYNVLAEHQYKLPTCSFVIYLRKRRVGKAPYERRFVDGRLTHTFHFRTIKLWEVTAQSIVELGWEGLLPLLPFTKGGKKPEIIQIMVDRLVEKGEKDLLALVEMFGGLAFTKESEKAWFKRRFAMFQDIMQDSWVYQELRQEMLEEGLTKGLKEGMEKGLKEGIERSLQTQRQAIVDIVQKRFPQLGELAFQQIAHVSDLDALRDLTVAIATTQDVETVHTLLVDAVKH